MRNLLSILLSVALCATITVTTPPNKLPDQLPPLPGLEEPEDDGQVEPNEDSEGPGYGGDTRS